MTLQTNKYVPHDISYYDSILEEISKRLNSI